MNEKLAARVTAKNRANKLAMDIHDKLAPIFAQYVGKKVETSTGSLVAKLNKEVDAAIAEIKKENCKIFRSQSRYSICYVVQTWENVGSCYYAETYIYLGETSNGILSKILAKNELKTDYSVDQILKAREEIRKARTILQNAESNLCGFGEYDN